MASHQKNISLTSLDLNFLKNIDQIEPTVLKKKKRIGSRFNDLYKYINVKKFVVFALVGVFTLFGSVLLLRDRHLSAQSNAQQIIEDKPKVETTETPVSNQAVQQTTPEVTANPTNTETPQPTIEEIIQYNTQNGVTYTAPRTQSTQQPIGTTQSTSTPSSTSQPATIAPTNSPSATATSTQAPTSTPSQTPVPTATNVPTITPTPTDVSPTPIPTEPAPSPTATP